MLAGKKILVGVCGSIAAYKSAHLIRLFIKAGASVRVVMTQAATDFITPLTLSTLSKNDVFVRESVDGHWNNHVEMGLWADAIVIAPVTANTVGKLANGLCDNLLTAVYLSARCPVFFSPAMDLDMWKHPATKMNIGKLKSNGNHIIEVNSGELASGLCGEGRMAEPEEIIQHLETYFANATILRDLEGKKVLVTAGPTVEPIDPVRYISNHSTGKMGFALAKELVMRGAEVTLLKGPTTSSPSLDGVKVVNVTTAEEMYNAAQDLFATSDIGIFAAAVADYTPAHLADKKIKKEGSTLTLELVKTHDILKALGERKKKGQLLVGFALETDNEVENAKGKLKKKNLDFIVLNSLQDKGAGFGHDTNKITVIDSKDTQRTYSLKSKEEVARDIVNEILTKVNEQ